MEDSTKQANQLGNHAGVSDLFTMAAGISLFWSCFFAMLMRNSFLDGDIDRLWYHLAIRISFLAFSCITAILVAARTDVVSAGKGHRILFGGAWAFPIVALFSSFTSFAVGLTFPLIFDIIAWGCAGFGLACLFYLWIEVLAAFEKPFVSQCLALSVVFGSFNYWIINALSFPLNISLLCLSSIASILLLKVLEVKGGLTPSAFVSLADSKQHAKPSSAHIGVLGIYGIVFGLGIGSTTQIQGGVLLFGSIAFSLIIGASSAYVFIRTFSKAVGQNEALRILFPVLIVALIPMSFLQGIFYTICNLLLLLSFICLTIIELDTQIWLATQKKASALYLVAMSQVPIYLGLSLGHTIGLLATITGAANYSMLSAVALGLVVVLAIFVTFAPFNPLASDNYRHKPEAKKSVMQGKWKNKCAAIAQEYGLSARETEVFMILAKGRGTEHIQKKLFISSHTVKTHTYNIYKKIDIGSRDELLDTIEAYKPNEDK